MATYTIDKRPKRLRHGDGVDYVGTPGLYRPH